MLAYPPTHGELTMTNAVPASPGRISHWIALSLLIVAALAVRSPALGLSALSSDESFSWRLTEYPVGDLIRRTGADVHPPVYYLALKAWVAVWGDSAAAMRSLSVLFGVLCAPLIYVVCREAQRIWPGPLTGRLGQAGAFVAAAVVVLHASQVTPSRVARMYAMGTFLAGLTAWLQLRALRSPRPGRWWAGYAIAVALFCYTHYYAFFTVAAQGLFVGLLTIQRLRTAPLREAATPVLGFMSACAVAFLLYSPWLPVLRGQVQQVRHEYWISPLTAQAIEIQFFSWATGLSYQGPVESRLLLLLLGGSVAALLWRRDWAGGYLLFQAALPWVLSLGISFFTGRTIFLERYLVFANVFFIGYLIRVLSYLPGGMPRAMSALFIATACLLGAWSTVSQYPREPSGLAKGAEFLKGYHRDGDLILTDSAHSLNRIRHYAGRCGLRPLDVKCRVPQLSAQGHFTHVASITSEEIWWEDRARAVAGRKRIWWATTSDDPGFVPYEGMQLIVQRTFGARNARFSLTLYERLEQ